MINNIIFMFLVGIILGLVICAIYSSRKEKSDDTQDEEKNPFHYKVKCSECYCWLDESDAQKVQLTFKYVYFCGQHKKPYSGEYFAIHTGKKQYFGQVEMSEDGTPVGYTKIKK